MKKLISCLLAVMLLVTAASAFAEPSAPVIKNRAVIKFLEETDWEAKDIALQIQSGEEIHDVVIRADDDNLHLVTRNGGVEESHVHLNPTGIYVGSSDGVTLLRYDTILTVADEIAKGLAAIVDEAIESAPKEEAPTEEEIKEALDELSVLVAETVAQEQADAVALGTAAASFVSKFKPEYILEVKEEQGSMQISLRSQAFAAALADAFDEVMSNPSLAKIVDRQAAEQGGKTFAEIQNDWLKNREATLNVIRSIESTEVIEANGHRVSHFQIGEEYSEKKILVFDTDTWFDEENAEVEFTACLGFKDEAPFMVHELAVNPFTYWEKLTAGDSSAEVAFGYEDDRITSGNITTVIEGKEELKAYFGPNYLYLWGPKGGISTSVRETWSGKIHYELAVETAKGQSASMFIDFYQEDDSLIAELYTDKSDRTVQFRLSRIDKVAIDDLSASENITEITVDDIYTEIGNVLKDALMGLVDDTVADK